jgi:hypothetical protein
MMSSGRADQGGGGGRDKEATHFPVVEEMT